MTQSLEQLRRWAQEDMEEGFRRGWAAACDLIEKRGHGDLAEAMRRAAEEHLVTFRPGVMSETPR